ncbi:MAG: hypothetical protein AAF602_30630, partial [Myxococcota bacterium]
MVVSLVVGSLVTTSLPLVAYWIVQRAARRRERAVLASPRPPPAPGRATATLVVLALLSLAGIVIDVVTTGQDAGPRMLGFLTGAVLLLVGVVTHAVPGHSRRGKYLMFTVGSSLMAMMPLSGERLARLGPTDPMVLGAGLLSALVVVAAAAYAITVLRPDDPPESPSRAAAHAWWRRLSFIQGPDPLSMLAWGVLSVLGLGPAYLLLRYAAKAGLERRPFLYLRSFGHEGAPRVFAEIIGPA